MVFIKSLDVQGFMGIKNATFTDLRNLNILIGVNNCGKTSILKAIKLLGELQGGLRFPDNDKCYNIQETWNNSSQTKSQMRISNLYCSLQDNQTYKGHGNVRISFAFRDDYIYDLLLKKIGTSFDNFIRMVSSSRAIQNADSSSMTIEFESLINHLNTISQENPIIDFNPPHTLTLTKNQHNGNMAMSHINAFSFENMHSEFRDKIVHCPDERLTTYKGFNLSDYILKSNPRKDDEIKLIDFIKSIVDSKIIDRRIVEQRKIDFVRMLEDEEFESAIDEQGSGVRSLVCLAWDIIRAKPNSIILIDEPETGINPAVKQAFLNFLLEESETKQIFIATHDPTFVNPVLWDKDKVGVFLYSVFDHKFVRVNLEENREDPEVFGGYLPHTVSLKDFHIYVEGSSDVYTFQVFLQKFLKEKSKKWHSLFNRVGIYHLGGGFWKHLLYTIPRPPYKSIIILDNDKKAEVVKIMTSDIFSLNKNLASLLLCTSMEHIENALQNDYTPVYCLQNGEIEDYIQPRPANKEDVPICAENMETLPDEIKQIFEVMLKDAIS